MDFGAGLQLHILPGPVLASPSSSSSFSPEKNDISSKPLRFHIFLSFLQPRHDRLVVVKHRITTKACKGKGTLNNDAFESL